MKKDSLWQKALKLPLSGKARWEWYIRQAYDLSIEEHNQMIAKQGGKCAICNKAKKLNIDHCHKSGRVRELLCTNCNYKVLGKVEKDPELYRKALRYLKKHG